MKEWVQPDDRELKEILGSCTTIAIVGMSREAHKTSHSIGRFLYEEGYKIIPVNPYADEIMGLKSCPSLTDIKEHVNIVNIFRPSNQVFAVVLEAMEIKADFIWMQLGIADKKAAELAIGYGIKVVMNKCIMVEHCRLL